MTTIKLIEGLSRRLDDAKAIIAEDRIHELSGSGGQYVVEGLKGAMYLTNGKCSCPDYQFRHEQIPYCKHVLAEMILKEQAKTN